MTDSRSTREQPPNLLGRCFVYIGNTSYSAYLWHWPVLGYFVYTNFDFGSRISDYALYVVVLALLVGATYHTIERHRFAITPVYSVAVLLLFVGGMYFLGRIERDIARFSSTKQMILRSARYDMTRCEFELNLIRGPFVVLFGESHAQMVREQLTRAAKAHGLEVLCIDGSRARLSTNRAAAVSDFKHAITSPGYLGAIFVMRWNMYALGFPPYEVEERGNRLLEWEGQEPRGKDEALLFFKRNLEALVRAINARDDPGRIGIMLQVPNMPFFPQKEALIDFHGLRFGTLPLKSAAEHDQESAPIRTVLSEIQRALPRVSILDPTPYLCDSGYCPYRDEWNVRYTDDDHLSVYGETLLAPMFDNWFETVIATP